MTQPQIKTYRRKVSDEKVETVAKSLFYRDWECRIPLVRKILEADADVIEAMYYAKNDDTMFREQYEYFHILPDGGKIVVSKTKEQFQQEWEEIE